MVIFGSPPRYDIYFEMINANFHGDYWLKPVEAGIWTWILFGFVYATTLAFTGFQALSGGLDLRRLAGIAAVAAAGTLQFYYYVGRSATPILVFIALPMLLLFLLSCDWALSAWRQRRTVALPVLAPVVLVAGLVAFGYMGGALVDRFFEPISRDLPNATLLRACLFSKAGAPVCSVKRMVGLIRGNDVRQGEYPSTESGGSLTYTHLENQSSYALIRRIAHEQKGRLFLFAADPVPIIFHSSPIDASRIAYPPLALGLVYPAVDGLSPTLRARALGVLGGAKAGDVVIRGSLPLSDLDTRGLMEIEKSWMLCPIDSLETVAAYKLQAKADDVCDDR